MKISQFEKIEKGEALIKFFFLKIKYQVPEIMDRPKTHPYCSRKYQVPVWHKPYKPILSKEERATPMLLCRQPEHVKGFDKKRIKQLATPKVLYEHRLIK